MFRFFSQQKRIAELEKEVKILKARQRVTDVFLSEIKETLRDMKRAEEKEVSDKEVDELMKLLFGVILAD